MSRISDWTKPKPSADKPSRRAAEQAIISWLAESRGRALTEQEIELALAQAEALGEL